MAQPEPGGYADRLAYALRLLDQGHTPEQVEGLLARYQELTERRPTSLSDPNNVLVQEVTEDGAAPRPS